MVKGVSKRVVVVRFPDTRVFDQAIFFVRDNARPHTGIGGRPGVTAKQIVAEACQVADSYVRRGKRRPRLTPALYALSGAALTGAAWLLTVFL
ncbi:MAG: translation initiation factor 2 [Oscillospiraceae bacterium]|nr:translation initiation factor 2 [Oscillospiraceae bacterium]